MLYFFSLKSPRKSTFPSDLDQGFCPILVSPESNTYVWTSETPNSDTQKTALRPLSVWKIGLQKSVGQTCYYVAIQAEQTVPRVCFQGYSRQVPHNCHSLTHSLTLPLQKCVMWCRKPLCSGKAIQILVYLEEWPLVAKHQKSRQGQ